MGHKISKEQIDPGIKDHIMSFVGDIADLETEVNTDIISAVNSLMVDRVDNTENMGKLANAIGEPVTANHSVDEVVEGLGEMLSTFKTNMMNSGVVVESSDKFKQLIDKIKGLTEGEGNKGIKYAEGTITVDSPFVITSNNPYTVSTNLDFTPSLVVVSFKSICSCSNITIDSVTATPNNKLYLNLGLQTYDYFYSSYLWLSDVTAESFKIYGSTTYSYSIGSGDPTLIQSSPFTWYAIGVGEEDTTLRDSLASILQEEGVDVTEEDSMASLITKVDEEFDRKNANVGKLNISVVSELPTNVINNKIVILSDTQTENIRFFSSTPVVGTNISEGEIAIIHQDTSDALTLYYEVASGIEFNLLYCYQVINGALVEKELYLGTNNEWKRLYHYILLFNTEKNVYADENTFGTYHTPGVAPTGDSDVQYSIYYNGNSNIILQDSSNDNGIYMLVDPISGNKDIWMDDEGWYTTDYTGTSYACVYTKDNIDVTGMNKLNINVTAETYYQKNLYFYFGLVDKNTTMPISSNSSFIVCDEISGGDNGGNLTLDISDYNGEYKIVMLYRSSYNGITSSDNHTSIIKKLEVTR